MDTRTNPPIDTHVPIHQQMTTWQRVRRLLVGKPRDLHEKSFFHRLTLIPFLAWVGLGADGLSSSSYGPDEAFRTLGAHGYLAVGLAALTALTVLIIAAAYSRIIAAFPHGGGGYVVATKLLGKKAGVVSGCALLVDYVLTIAVSIAASGDALFSFLPLAWQPYKLPVEVLLIAGLTLLNIRGVKESVMALLPIFLVFLATHLFGIGYGVVAHLPQIPETAQSVASGFTEGLSTLGFGGMMLLFLHAYSLGGGTYTGIEAVSNGLPILREPRVENGKRTMLYMALSLAVTAAGLLVCYLLWQVQPSPGKTMNAVLWAQMAQGFPGGAAFVILSLFSEGALLVVAAQAGFIDGPRVLANMAVDSYMPRRFSALSDRLTTQNGILLMGAASTLVLWHAAGDVRHLVVMYSINVFLTFSLSMFGMLKTTFLSRKDRPGWKRPLALFGTGFLFCATILLITVAEKFGEGGWLTLTVTTGLIGLSFAIRRHYKLVGAKLAKLYKLLEATPVDPDAHAGAIDATRKTAVLLVVSYGGVGIHTLQSIFRMFPRHFHNLIMVSVGVLDSGEFKGEAAVRDLHQRTKDMLKKYVKLANGMGIAADSRYVVGIDAVEQSVGLCLKVAEEFPNSTFFAGKIIFQKERWYQRILHNETAFAIQRRLQWAGKTMVIIPATVD